MMGAYAVALAVGASLAAGATVPAVEAFGGGWRTGLGVWGVTAAVALAVWLPLVLRRDRPAAAPSGSLAPGALRRDPRAWQVTAFMGLQSLSFYSVLAWLPSVFRDQGLSAASAGGLLSVLAAVGIPVGLVLPTLVARRGDQRGWVAVVTAVTLAGLLGVALAPGTAPLLWAVLIGLGQGSAFPLALTLVVLRSRDAADAARLSAMSQGIGYCVAATGPLVVGALHDASGSWRLPFGLLAALLVPQLLAGLAAGRAGHVGAAAATAPAR
jgi:CP family cyanate transporter-like MFS transporter